jgi:hypothetical protein
MRTPPVLAVCLWLCVSLAAAAAPREEPQVTAIEEGPVVSYLIEARLFPGSRRLTASQTLTWRNVTPHTVDHLRFHLYYNGFRDVNSTFMQEAKYYKVSKERQEELKFGKIDIVEIRRIGGSDLSGNMRFISPDDGNPNDKTVLRLDLEDPVGPNQVIHLKIDFALVIPQIFSRTGMEEDFFFMAQWFPKIGVLQADGQWHCHQFHHVCEFFADYGDYRVALTVPGKFVVGASGNLVKSVKNANNTVTYEYWEKDIHDFAWTAYPHFTRYSEELKLNGRADPVSVELLLAPGHPDARFRYLDSMKFALSFFDRHIFAYPYKKLMMVDPPLKGIDSGGMEYPTLVTGGHFETAPGALKLTEAVAVHETAHQYWYGLVGTDEFREAWLDEGIASFFESEILEEYFKGSGSFLDSGILKIAAWEADRWNFSSLPAVDPINLYSWKFVNVPQYVGNVYFKAGIFLRSLKNLVGKERMYNFFKHFAEKYKFKHPTTQDFIATFNAFMNEDFSWAFDQFINGTANLDHAVYRLESVKIATNPDKYRNEAIFLRLEGYFPVDLLVILDNGKEIKAHWKEKNGWKKIVFEDASPIKAAVIDPLYKLPLDRNFLNNSKVRRPDRSALERLALKAGFLYQNILGMLVL